MYTEPIGRKEADVKGGMQAPVLPRPLQCLPGPPDPDDFLCQLDAGWRMARGQVTETRQVIALARRFNEEILRPMALDLDKRIAADPDHLPWDIVNAANEWGFYTMWIPKAFGGQGFNFPSMAHFIEEISAECVAVANVIGVHYLGVATLCATWNARLINRICREVVAGEKAGKPCLLSLAITEPGAGTDVEEVDLVDRANLVGHARRVDGGYLVNGTKIFISMGHMSTWHMTICYTDLEKPSENTVMLAVKTGQKGFSFGRVEHKMGQKACCASELIFKDCFVPDENVGLTADQVRHLPRPVKKTIMQVIDYVVSTSRAGVGAFGTGVARGAFERAAAFAATHEVEGKPLVEHEWARCLLAEMHKNVCLARLASMEVNHANGLYGFFRRFHTRSAFIFHKHMPQAVLDRIYQPLFNRPMGTRLLRRLQLRGQTDCEIHRTSGWGSLAKFACTDLGIRNCHMALSLMGQAGLRHDMGTEKLLRDAKLLQIYEGTNQLNRLNLFKCLIAPCACPAVETFEEN